MPRKHIINPGDRFHKLVAVELINIRYRLHPKYKRPVPTRYYWLFNCDCGKTVVREKKAMFDGALLNKRSSCGCALASLNRQRQRTHGVSGLATYNSWRSMILRCDPGAKQQHPNHAGRGITIHKPWIESIEEFIKDVGLRPSRLHTLDRINNDGNYEPGNVRWATKAQQGRNRRTTRMLTAFGSTKPLVDFADEYKIKPACLKARLRSGMAPEEALTRPTKFISRNCQRL
jgi:hypothetical protein